MCEDRTCPACTPACPAYAGPAARFCAVCRQPFAPHEGAVGDGQQAVCGECAEGLSLEGLLDLLGLPCVADLLAAFGFVPLA